MCAYIHTLLASINSSTIYTYSDCVSIFNEYFRAV